MTEFNEAYVKKLREEAATYRVKCRELEANQHRSTVETELAKRGVEANPDWVKIEEGQSVEDAVENLIATYPGLEKGKEVEVDPELYDFTPEPKLTPRAIAPSTHMTTTPKPVRSTRISKRNISEIRKDPKARSKVRDLYRELLTKGSNQGE